MAANSFCMLLVGLLVIAIASFLAAFGTSWGMVDSDYALSPAPTWLLVGGLTARSARFKMKVPQVKDATSIFTLVVSTSQNLTENRTERVLGADVSVVGLDILQGIYTLTAEDLIPETQYYYAIVERHADDSGGVVVSNDLLGKIRTPAEEGTRFNFTIATAGCAWTGSRAPIFNEIEKENALMFIHLGDLHYSDIDVPDMKLRIDAISTVLASEPQAELYRSTSFVNMWDDHDWLGNNANGVEEVAGARDTALISYRAAFPHYPLAAAKWNETDLLSATATAINTSSTTDVDAITNSIAPPVPVYQAFTIGTVRFVVSDLRSESTNNGIYSPEQEVWLKDEFSRAADYDFVIWVTTKPWIGEADPGGDSWSGYPSDRRTLSDYISQTIGTDNGPQNLMAISADAHMIGFDSGFNTFYGSSANASASIKSFPILQSGSLDRMGSAKGTTYSGGCFAYSGERTQQYSTVSFEFDVDGGQNCIQIESYRKVDFVNENKRPIFSKRLCGKIFIDAAVSEDQKVGTCDIEILWDVNSDMGIASFLIAMGTVALSWVALYNSDAVNFTDCCCKSIVSALIISLSYILTPIVGFGVFFLRGVEQFSVAPTLIIVLVQMVLNFFYLLIWWVCCTSPNKRSLDDDDPAFRDVEPNPTFRHPGMDIQYNRATTNGDSGEGEAPGGNSSTNDSAHLH